MTEFVLCENNDDMPRHPHKAVRAPDEFKSIVCHWPEKEEGTWGRASVDEYCSGLQAWFPWGGQEYDSQNFDNFQVLVKHGHYRYSWIRVERVRENPEKFRPLELNGYSPAVISGRLGKIKIDSLRGWSSWGGDEIEHDENEVENAIVLCVREKNFTDAPAHFKNVSHGDELPHHALQSEDREGSYVCMWNDEEEGTFGRIRLNDDDQIEAWFPYGGQEYASQDIGCFQVLCKDHDYKYKWKDVSKVLKRPEKYEVLRVNGYSPGIVDGLLGKINLENEGAWHSWDSEERYFGGDDFENAEILCYKEKEDD
ncbi:uncharacterized protein LOC135486637 [Lineus longissimus]|uniref:uncharacterized protein LOC135486637 n=1 Tax=Lineus longissimus TaxID=88925 RepID=UPI002B4CB64F